MPRYKSSTRWPLGAIRAIDSRVLVRCYAMEGRYWTAVPPKATPLRLLLIAPDRSYAWADGTSSIAGPWACQTHQAPWGVAGWLPADGSLPLGEPDELDPNVARLTFLHSPVAPTPAIDEARILHTDHEHKAGRGKVSSGRGDA